MAEIHVGVKKYLDSRLGQSKRKQGHQWAERRNTEWYIHVCIQQKKQKKQGNDTKFDYF